MCACPTDHFQDSHIILIVLNFIENDFIFDVLTGFLSFTVLGTYF